jgi:hypothetical protein
MRKIFAILSVCLVASLGCKHVGGKCDCGPVPGDAATYAPYNNTAVKTEVVAPMPTAKEMPNVKK